MSEKIFPTELLMNRSAESCVLASMVIDHKLIPVVLELLTEDSFAFAENRAIFQAILTVWRRNRGGAVDGVLLRSQLEETRALESVGGLAYLKEVVESVPTSTNATFYAEQVMDRQRYRAAVAAVEEMRDRLAEGGRVDEIIQHIHHLALGLDCRSRRANIFHVRDHATAVALATQEKRVVIPTGFRDVDHLAGGVCPGDLAIVAARPSMGKTSFLCDWALNAARGDIPVVFITLEMTAPALMERMSAMLGRVSLATIKRPDPPKSLLDKFYQGSLELEGLPITVVESAATVEQIRATVRQIKQAESVGLVFLDYIGLMSAGESRRQNRNEQITEISRGLKLMAQSQHLPLIVASQLNRECEGRDNHRPRLSDLRDSGSLEQDADLTVLLHREDYYRRMRDPAATEIDGLADVLVAKARNGPTGLTQLVFLEELMTFANVARIDEGEMEFPDAES